MHPAAGPAESTVRARNSDWSLFADWCRARDRTALPASPATVRAFLDEMPATAVSMRRRASTIARCHRDAGFADPAGELDLVDGLREVAGLAPLQPLWAPPAPGELTFRIESLPRSGWPQAVFGRRDAAVLAALAAAMPLRRCGIRAAGIWGPRTA